MRDLRHDNLNQLIGASIDSPNICILTDYCARGSLRVLVSDECPPRTGRNRISVSAQDVLQNEDVHLDNIFIASLVGDILRVTSTEGSAWRLITLITVARSLRA